MSETNYLEQLQLLKGMTVRTGSIHEAQAMQLRNWLLLIPGVVKGQAKVDTIGKVVMYKCKGHKSFKKTQRVLDFCTNIEKWTRTILWDETAIVVSVNDRGVYDSRAKA